MALALAGCGGGSNSGSGAVGDPPRGTLLQNPPELVSLVSAATLLLELNAATNLQLLALGGTPLCDIAVYHMRYETVGGTNEATTASGALMVPIGVDAKCNGARPIILYAHGTTTDRAFNIANVQNQSNAEGLFLAAFFASQGYIVVAPNYAGYDTSTLPYHPYLIADQQSKDMIDALTAARSALPVASAPLTRDSGQPLHHGLLAGWLRRDGDASRHAGRWHDSHRIGADVRALCTCGLRRHRVLRSGQRQRSGVIDVAGHGVPEIVRQCVRQPRVTSSSLNT